LDLSFSDHFSPNERGVFEPLRDALLKHGDHYMRLADPKSYLDADRRIVDSYADQGEWARRAILNVASSGKFSSDRTVAEYAKDIWSVEPCPRPANIRGRSLAADRLRAGNPIWHDARMLQLARVIVEVLADLVKLAVLFLRSASAIRAENLALRRQLAAYIERGIRPRRLDHAGRVSLSVLARLFSWRDAIVIVRPSTVIRWHRLGWRIFWRWKGRSTPDSAGTTAPHSPDGHREPVMG
jgi:hypothetical protein